MRKCLLFLLLPLWAATANAHERFVYLTTDDVRIDSILPSAGYDMPLPDGQADSVYTVQLLYPDFIDMAPSDIEKYNAVCGEALPEVPEIEYNIVFDRKKPILKVHLVPLAFREGKYKWLVSFMLKITSSPAAKGKGMRKASSAGEIYTATSMLATGNWAKIRVGETGIYELTNDVIKSAGFSDLSKVKIYGYGGNLQPEAISADYLAATDDLSEVAQCIAGGKHLFYAKGPVSWDSNTSLTRTRNPYSDYGYYFITESDDDVATLDSAAFVSQFYHAPEDYHSLYEEDGYAWYQGGRNLVDPNSISLGSSRTFSLANDTGATSGTVYINVTVGQTSTVTVAFNDSVAGTLSMTCGTYDKGAAATKSFYTSNLKATNTVTVTAATGGAARLDYISIAYDTPRENYALSGTHPAAEYVYNITNQNHHADDFADMVIIIPTSQKLLSQAERLKAFHEERDGMRVTIVPADELYNEFSSGTPDANAYRRYLKMLYDRAATEADFPKYLLLFGDCVWDNRMLTTTTQGLSPDDYLLCFESEDSYNEITCYVDDGFFCLLDEGEGVNPQSADLLDVAVGRFPVTTENEAKILVDKTIAYVENENAGAWQNTLMFLGDDGNENEHMEAANEAADIIADAHPQFLVKKVMWDSYERVSSATGHTYPEVTSIVKAQQEAGALLIDYCGHGSATAISHEYVLSLLDFQNFTNTNLPLWITASCDIMPFDGTIETIGEAAVLNAGGGSFAFFGTTRTVYSNYNKRINEAFLKNIFDTSGENLVTLGEAQRLTKNYLITSGQDRTTNKLQYSLLGDPAVALNIPRLNIVVDSINGTAVNDSATVEVKAGGTARVAGHVVTDEAFDGTVAITVRDSEETVKCRLNDTTSSGASTAFTYTDRTKTVFSGSDNIESGQFAITFAVPMDINYSGESGLITLFANTSDAALTAHGYCENITLSGTDDTSNDGIGPSLFCYLNDPSFSDGGDVNPTPYFVAQIYDEDGLNTSGVGVGHNLQLAVDNDASTTYDLNDEFVYDFGSYTSGSVGYSIPELSTGAHSLRFRAWDIFNNSSTTTLNFNVVAGLTPGILDISLTQNPASTTTTFIVSHDRLGSDMDVVIDVFDTSGRQLWQHRDNGVTNSGAYTYTWDLTCANGQPLRTGVYVYRVRIASDGSSYKSKAKKLIVMK
ncbi:MAG: type IX secretion system sortase PorU [Prevotella sp.]|nr:type IX secretion system sortase PorU [Prevotella sp.]